MTLNPPFSISARLMPALVVCGATISLGPGDWTAEGRMAWACWIDLPDGSAHEITDFHSGVGGGALQDAFATLLGFLSAAAESRAYRERTGRPRENEDLFVPAIVEWAAAHSDDITSLGYEIEETEDLITN